MATADSSASPDTGATSSTDDTGGASYTIEISVTPDGISVGVESADQENAEQGAAGAAGGAGGEAATPVKSIKEALTLALEIYRADGEMPETSGTSPEDAMDAGYSGTPSATSTGGNAGAASAGGM